MTLLEQAKAFREAFTQETKDGFAPDGFIKEQLYDMQLRLIEEEVKECFRQIGLHTIDRLPPFTESSFERDQRQGKRFRLGE